MFHRLGGEERVECLHRETGARYWKFSYPTNFEDRYGYNNGPRASPVIDGDHLYTIGAEGKLHCLKLETGQIYWKRDLRSEFKVPQDFFGTASTPLIEGDLLIVNVGAPGGPTVIALDKKTGKMVWGAGDQWGPSYASPVPANVNGHRRIFVFAGGESRPPSGGLISIDPKTGAVDFSFPWRSKSYESVNAACPLVVGNQVFVSASYKTGGALLNLSAEGGGTVAWTTQDLATHFNTSIYKDGYLYGFDGCNEPRRLARLLGIKNRKGDVAHQPGMGRAKREATAKRTSPDARHSARHAAFGRWKISVPGRAWLFVVARSDAERIQRAGAYVAFRGSGNLGPSSAKPGAAVC